MNNRRSGMTLMELVIALTILAIMATAGGVAFSTIIDRQETIRTASAEVERAAALRETVRQWVLQGDILVQRGNLPRGGASSRFSFQAVNPAQQRGQPAGVTAAASTGPELTVNTNGPNPLNASNVSIRIFVDADLSTPEEGLTIEYRAAGSTQSPLMRRQLDASVGDMTLEFYDYRTNRWLDYTQVSTIEPIAVRLTMLPAEGATLARMLQVPLTIVFGEAGP
jgi:prepilin-type N-terminal cleavage/methylation domain-containing protein